MCRVLLPNKTMASHRGRAESRVPFAPSPPAWPPRHLSEAAAQPGAIERTFLCLRHPTPTPNLNSEQTPLTTASGHWQWNVLAPRPDSFLHVVESPADPLVTRVCSAALKSTCEAPPRLLMRSTSLVSGSPPACTVADKLGTLQRPS